MAVSDSYQPNLWQIFGHYSQPVWPFFVVGGSIANLIADPGTTIGGITSWISTGGLGLLIVFNLWAHQGKLCLLCVQSVPLNPNAQAEKHDSKLRAFHWLGHHMGRAALYAAAVAIGAMLAVTVLDTPRRAVSLCTLFVFDIPLAYLTWASYRHSQLRPWCPYCKDDGEDEAVEAPDPDPAIHK